MVLLTEINKYLQYIFPGLTVFFRLYVCVFLLDQVASWSDQTVQTVQRKVKLLWWGFIAFFTAWWLVLDLPEFRGQDRLVNILWAGLFFFLWLMVMDVLSFLFFDEYMARIRGVGVPQIITNLIRGIYLLIIILVILSGMFKYDVRPFLTGSAILTAIIGLALQDTMGNLISGLALHLSRPFDLHHWIRFGTVEGEVVKIDWRATTVKTREEDYVTIPNSNLAKGEIINFSTPTVLHAVSVVVGVRYEYPPYKVIKVLRDAVLSAEGVEREMSPAIFLESYDDFSINYRIRFFMKDYFLYPKIKSRVMERIWYYFKREGIEIPFPIRDIYIKKEVCECDEDYMVGVLSKIDFLQDVEEEMLKEISRRVRVLIYEKGETVINQGDEGDTFFIIKSGTAGVMVRDKKGETFLTQDLGPGEFFGEISVLTGEPRSATVIAKTELELLALNKGDFETVLKKSQDLDTMISKKIASRQQRNFEEMIKAEKRISDQETRQEVQEKVENLSQQILEKIRKFFFIRKR